MLHFSTGILLYLAIGVIAAPFQARDTTDSSSSTVSADPSDKLGSDTASSETTDTSTGATGTTTGTSTSTSGTASGDSASITTSTSTSASSTATGDSSLSSSESPTDGSIQDKTSDASSTGTDTSTSAASAATFLSSGDAISSDSSLGELNQTLLFGPDLRPNITHLGAMQAATKDSANSSMFEAAGSILLALAKCNDHGYWISSMFGLPDPGDGTQEEANKNQSLAGVQIHKSGAKPEDPLIKFNVTVNKENLVNVTSAGITSDKISADEPWWPWALIEAGLQAGWVPEAEDGAYQVNVLLQLLTGVPVKEVKPDDYFYGNVTDHLQSTPVLLREKDQAIYSVLMTPAYNDTTGHPRLPLAGAYLHPDEGAQFANNTLLEDLKPRIDKVLYLDGLLSLREIQKMQKEDTDDKKSDGAEALAAGSDDTKSTGGESDGATASEAKTTEGTSTDAGATGDSTFDSGSATATSTSAGATGESTSDSTSSTGTSTSAEATGEGTSDIGSTSATSTTTGSGDSSSEVKPSATV